MTFLAISRVTKILCSFRLVLERQAGRKIPESPDLQDSTLGHHRINTISSSKTITIVHQNLQELSF